VKPPLIVYGTAWKEDTTEACVVAALAAGFRGIDTANQRKHYFEEGVGRAIARSGVPRTDLWLQTKFTYRDGQDDRLPYDPDAPIAKQVAQSFQSSLEHLATKYIDSYVLHGPSQREGLGSDDHEAWRAMETLPVRALGISNVTARQVDELAAFTKKPIAFVQNRCYAERGWDADVRAACARHGIMYQGFSLLTANRYVLAIDTVRALSKKYSATPAQIVFRFSQHLDMVPLTGTKNPEHMKQDLAAAAIPLAPNDVEAILANS
jgi:diketogulonate reductase-like aldo/keto reductase